MGFVVILALTSFQLTAMRSSTAIEDLKDISAQYSNVAVIYWYFTFTDTEKQNVSNCLSSMIADACSNLRYTPEVVQKAYDQANYGQQSPTQDSQLTMLKETVAGFDHLYLVIDALDECPKNDGEREKLLGVIEAIHGWKTKCVHIMATSRNETDIATHFEGMKKETGFITEICLQNTHVEEDIKNYVRLRLKHKSFSKWKPKLKIEVESSLAAKADGMYVFNEYSSVCPSTNLR